MIIAYFPLTPFTWKSIWFEAVYSCSIKIADLKNFAYFTGRHLCRSLLLNKFAGCEHLQTSLIFKWQIKKERYIYWSHCSLHVTWQYSELPTANAESYITVFHSIALGCYPIPSITVLVLVLLDRLMNEFLGSHHIISERIP